MTGDEVAERLGILPGTEARRYVEELAAEAPVRAGPAGPVGVPGPAEARRHSASLGLSPEETEDVVASLPSPGGDAAWWWCAERAAGRIVRRMGDPAAPRGTWPSWEGPGHDLARRCHLLHVALAVAPHTLAHFASLGVGDDVARASLNDVARHAGIHRRVHGTTGMDAGWWVVLSLRAELVELGRLQFNRIVVRGEDDESPPWFGSVAAAASGDGFRTGDECLGVHIPEDGPLEPELVEASLRAAGAYFGRHHPLAAERQRRRVATCRSWLLDPQLAGYLPEGSRILAFQRRFELVPERETGDGDVLEFVFRARPDVNLDALPQRTRLERAVVAHLRSGGRWHRRTGWLELPAP